MADSFQRVGADLVVRDFSRQGVTGFLRNMQLVRRDVGAMQRTIGAAFGIGVGYFGFRGLVEGYKSVISAARDAAESDNLFRMSLGDSADAVSSWSRDISQALGLNDVQVRSNIGTYKLMLESMGLTETGAISMGKSLTQLAYDMASFRNINPTEAFGKIQSGLTGEVEPLKKLGIIVNETSVQEYALRQGWIQHGEQLSEVGKIYARFGLIMQQTQKDQGDLARTADSAANQERRLQAQWEQARIALGQALLPSYQQAMSTISTYLQTNLDDVRDWAQGTASVLAWLVDRYAAVQRSFGDLVENTVGKQAIELAAQERYRTLTGDASAFTNTWKGQGWAGHFERVEPQDQAAYEAILNQLREEQKQVQQDREAALIERQKLSGTYAAPPEVKPFEYPQIEIPNRSVLVSNRNEEAAATKKATDEVRRHMMALRQEYEIIGRLDESRYRASDYVEMRQAVSQLSDDEAQKLLQEMRLKQEYNDLTVTQTELLKEYETQLMDLRGAEMINETMQDLAGTLTDISFDFEHATEMADRFFDTLARNLVNQYIMQPLTDALGGGIRRWLMGDSTPATTTPAADPNSTMATVAHSGGRIGISSLPSRSVPSNLFADAPRMHSGGYIGPGEVPIIAKRGEEIRPAGSGSVRPNVTVNFSNETGTAMAAPEVETDFNLDEYIVNVVLKNETNGGAIRDRFGRRR